MILLLPLSFASNFFYSYQGAFAFVLFDPSTRALGGILSGLGSIFGAAILGFILDIKVLRRKQRAFLGLAIGFTASVIIGSCGLAYQLTFTRATVFSPQFNYKDTSSAFRKPIALLFFYYVVDAFVQSLAYWTMGSLTNDRELM